VVLMVLMVRMLMMCVAMLVLGCEHVRLRIEFTDDETEQIGQFRWIPPTSAIADAVDVQ
jgi:hypothetical protein